MNRSQNGSRGITTPSDIFKGPVSVMNKIKDPNDDNRLQSVMESSNKEE